MMMKHKEIWGLPLDKSTFWYFEKHFEVNLPPKESYKEIKKILENHACKIKDEHHYKGFNLEHGPRTFKRVGQTKIDPGKENSSNVILITKTMPIGLIPLGAAMTLTLVFWPSIYFYILLGALIVFSFLHLWMVRNSLKSWNSNVDLKINNLISSHNVKRMKRSRKK